MVNKKCILMVDCPTRGPVRVMFENHMKLEYLLLMGRGLVELEEKHKHDLAILKKRKVK
ncbi:MAG: hypothetical protein NTX79_04885 [Candidatus Micrarchaeota archaeon]|nr:hypothetical protein [Candidatus Micrarchaeota archaeon]